MKDAIYQEALNASAYDKDLIVSPVTDGLINHTYKITIKSSGYKYLLQCINRFVFTDPEKVQHNYEKIWSYLEERKTTENNVTLVKIPEPLHFLDHSYLFCDNQMQYWRMTEFIDNAVTIHHVENISQARKVAHTFASLTKSFEFYDLQNLHIPIPGFHDLSFRFRQFKQSLHSRMYDRLLKSSSIIDQLKKREHYVSFFEIMTESAAFKKRLMHHDAKISNILFDDETGHVICPVDFDTCMPGYFFSDLGDMIRSMACSEPESGNNYNNFIIRKDIYENIVDSYLEVLFSLLTDAEKKYIHYSGLLIIYMQALRFLSDYLNGDLYYKIDYPEHNFNRTMNQLTVLQKLEEFLFTNYQFKI
ncbi:MAG: phosphotransferase enzyme family protein [Chitinophagaceae bacterium]